MVSFNEEIMMSANLGAPSPLPDIKNVDYIHAGYEVMPSLNDDERKYLGKGLINTILPYTIQNTYDREQKERPVKTVVLENEKLKAVFLPEYGARLWQLYDKVNNKDLLFTNPVIQPCNFAIRNAWIAGGVEFNIGVKGHSTLTCEPMFTELIGDDAVAFYEYERIRGLAYKITAILPKGSETLYIRTTVENNSDTEKYMYWWSNIAFPETKDTRVIVPADDAIHCLYQENHYALDKSKIPFDNEVDVTYSLNLKSSSDYFYKIPDNCDKWEAAVDKNGIGLLQYSEPKLKGRKLFLWGYDVGGRHWNDFLSKKDMAYIEIQAGLLYTQLEHILMPAKTTWEWTEGYTALDGTDKDFYGDWETAQNAVKKQFNEKIERRTAVDFKDLKNVKTSGESTLVFNGKGWGAVESALNKKLGKAPVGISINFPVVKNSETGEWLFLLENGYLPKRETSFVPVSYVCGQGWKDLLIKSLENPNGNHWYTYLHLGVVYYELGEIENAKSMWEKSIDLESNMWALRNLAMLYKNEYKIIDKALELMWNAYNVNGDEVLSFIREYGAMLTENGQDELWLTIYEKLSDELKKDGRLQIYLAFAYLHLGMLSEAKSILSVDFVMHDVKEGELSLSKLWFDIHTAIIMKDKAIDQASAIKLVKELYPLPYELDFRMHD